MYFYSFRRKNVREIAVEVIKMRGEEHQKKIFITNVTNEGIKVYPEQEISDNFR